MSSWLNADVRIGDRSACLVVDELFWRGAGMPDVAELLRTAPELAERVVCDAIADVCPGWAGGVLWGIRFDMMRARWEFFYTHRAFPKVREGDARPMFALLPGEDAKLAEGAE